MLKKFVKWSSLNQFHEVVKSFNYNRVYQLAKQNDMAIEYALKIKLHGTNACVRVESDGGVFAQKRSSDIEYGSDNFGFRTWVDSNEAYFGDLARSDATLYIFGEWAGPGVQSNVAVSNLDKKHFFVFTVDIYKDDKFYQRIYSPEYIENILGVYCPDDIIVLPIHSTLKISYESKADAAEPLARLNQMVEGIGNHDPFIAETFGIEGQGEGVVAYPLLGRNRGAYDADEIDYFSYFNFKAKSEAHRVNKSRTSVTIDPEKLQNANSFADKFCTEQRFEQGFLEALDRDLSLKLIPVFLKWVMTDIHKESKTEVEESGQDWNMLSKACSSRAVEWYKSKVAGGY